ncbi:MAG: UDP-4-amino-4,6-dideoxy-N-acetyl-beta-L-altrosamine transaminase [Candidatus Endolissoclinum sp. TMED37]|nr:MAG: UDP-4-amino-4,6-dideoxy-N-acetyl-beta-L-altrosamine transaminase [Candidatus Endolissoclinum sp. TMED37]
MIKFPYARPDLTEADKNAVLQSLDSQFLTGGSIIKKFENKISKEFKVENAIVCNSGTAALHLIYNALGLSNGDTILTSPITFVATANAARMCGAEVVFADVDPDTGLLTADRIEKAILSSKSKIKIITVVHLGGRLCDLESISKIAKKYKCLLVEDACHAPGAIYYDSKKNKSRVGECNYSIASSFSFHAIKHITMAEGGCITTNNNKIAKEIKNKLNHAMIKNKNNKFKEPWYYQIKELGWNYRASEINCALGYSQISRLKKLIKKRKQIANLYRIHLQDFSIITFPKNSFDKDTNAWHLFTIFIDFKKLKIKKKDLVQKLEKKGIGTQVHYIPIFLQPFYKHNKNSYFRDSIIYYKKSLSLPLYVSLKDKDIIYICKTLKSILTRNEK